MQPRRNLLTRIDAKQQYNAELDTSRVGPVVLSNAMHALDRSQPIPLLVRSSAVVFEQSVSLKTDQDEVWRDTGVWSLFLGQSSWNDSGAVKLADSTQTGSNKQRMLK